MSDEIYSVNDVTETLPSRLLSFFRLSFGRHMLKNKKGEKIQVESDLGFAFNTENMNGVIFEEQDAKRSNSAPGSKE